MSEGEKFEIAMKPGAGDFTKKQITALSSEASRKASTLKRRLEAALAEVRNINDKGRQAITDQSHVDVFRGMFRAINKYFEKFEAIWEDLVDLYDEAGMSMGFPSTTEAQMKSSAQRYFYEANTNFEKLNSRVQSSFSVTQDNSVASRSLPSIKLPDFSGDITQWPKFRDIYMSLVHNEDTLSPSMKFQYLKSSLKGAASSVISRFSIEDDTNYPLAWKAVIDTYNNKRMLATTYLTHVLDFKPLQGKATVESLQTFRSTVSDSIAAFKLLNIEDPAEFILFHLASKALDPRTREQFEISSGNTEFPTFQKLDSFVNERCLALQLASSGSVRPFASSGTPNVMNNSGKLRRPDFKMRLPKQTALLAGSTRPMVEKNRNSKQEDHSAPCFVCKNGERHHLLSCPTYDAAKAVERANMLRNWTGCTNCLSSHHRVADCKSRWHCRFCPERHHASLHQHITTSRTTPASSHSTAPGGPTIGSSLSSTACETHVLLGTVVAEVQDARGHFQTIRLVVDSGSQYSFITKKCLDRLGLPATKFPKKISGIGQTIFEGAKGKTSIVLRPTGGRQPELFTEAIVVTGITSYLPSVNLPTDLQIRFSDYTLADPKFWQPSAIDFLLGADLFAEICTGSTITFEPGYPRLLSSVFGHIVLGRYGEVPNFDDTTSLFALGEPLDLREELKRFWELEEPPTAPPTMSPEDVRCEEFFKNTHRRAEDGHYIVRIPFKEDKPVIGDSSKVALKRFINLERKLSQSPKIREKYLEFMDEYISMNHMSPASSIPKFHIPHHCVTREAGSDFKIRVVFDASVRVFPATLNDVVMTGPNLQKDLRIILMKFRRHRFVFMTDAVKMFRMIWVDEADWPYQSIYWRPSPNSDIETYFLRTVTYGMGCSPYLALRIKEQLCIDEGHNFPLAAKAVSQDVYMDDLATGTDTLEEVLELQQQVIHLMKSGGFTLSKWASNCDQVLRVVSPEQKNAPVPLSKKDDQTVKVLGLKWDPVLDCFLYDIKEPEIVYTKRAILSIVARIFDPIGFLVPITLQLKAHLQELWRSSVQQLPCIREVRISRFIQTSGKYTYQAVGFADASTKAYCAALYLRIQYDAQVHIFLLSAKSRLAPVKTASVPRLELCAALLLSDLYKSMAEFFEALTGNAESPVFFSDSTIVLGWLKTPSYLLKTFVCNRVVSINDSIPVSQWQHVRSEENPADLGSRGVYPADLVNSNLWWKGPSWLVSPQEEWPQSLTPSMSELPELKSLTSLAATKTSNLFIAWMMKFSSYDGLVRTVAWVNRWVYNTKHVGCCCCRMRVGSLTLQEIQQATTSCIRAVQRHHFFGDKEPTMEAATKQFPNLTPYLDSSKLLRVGGRLSQADLCEDKKHPILLPNDAHFSYLLVDHYHKAFLHPGPTQLQALIQMRYWIPSLRRVVRKRGFLCMVCYRSKGKIFHQLMGDLPQYRLEGGQAFKHVGVDFAGPWVMRDSLRRKAQTSKIYLCLYVCMVTKAVHLEAVTRLTTDGFIASFQRFMARRGVPSVVYSDNGTNFVGAARHLKELYSWFRESSTRHSIHGFATNQGVDWRFNPPQTPHMGGIWEAGVKSVKTRLRRIAGDSALTYEEFATLFAQIEASLNSRPLCPISSDPGDVGVLTPGHFLVGGPLQTIPEPSLMDLKMNLLDRWQLIQRMCQQFWRQWRMEYLATLQTRCRWQRKTLNLEVGDLVTLKEDTTPLHWPVARVVDVHPGNDGQVRVVSLRTANNTTLRRHVHQCAPLLPLKEPPYGTKG